MPEDTKKPQSSGDVILSSSGEPFKTEGAAKTAMRMKRLDDSSYDVIPHGSGFAITRKASGPSDVERDIVLGKTTPGSGQARIEHAGQTPTIGGKERYFWVRFHDKSRPADLSHVELGCNCEYLKIQRNKWVILPERFVEVAQHAEFPQYSLEPGQMRQQIGMLKVWPHDIGNEATEAEYREMLTAGTRADKEAMVRDRPA